MVGYISQFFCKTVMYIPRTDAAQISECFFPGKFGIWFESPQIFPILVLAAALIQFLWRLQTLGIPSLTRRFAVWKMLFFSAFALKGGTSKVLRKITSLQWEVSEFSVSRKDLLQKSIQVKVQLTVTGFGNKAINFSFPVPSWCARDCWLFKDRLSNFMLRFHPFLQPFGGNFID